MKSYIWALVIVVIMLGHFAPNKAVQELKELERSLSVIMKEANPFIKLLADEYKHLPRAYSRTSLTPCTGEIMQGFSVQTLKTKQIRGIHLFHNSDNLNFALFEGWSEVTEETCYLFENIIDCFDSKIYAALKVYDDFTDIPALQELAHILFLFFPNEKIFDKNYLDFGYISWTWKFSKAYLEAHSMRKENMLTISDIFNTYTNKMPFWLTLYATIPKPVGVAIITFAKRQEQFTREYKDYMGEGYTWEKLQKLAEEVRPQFVSEARRIAAKK